MKKSIAQHFREEGIHLGEERGIHIGEERGVYSEKHNVAGRMLQEGFDAKTIEKISGLSFAEIQALQNSEDDDDED